VRVEGGSRKVIRSQTKDHAVVDAPRAPSGKEMHAIVMRACRASQNGTPEQPQRGPDARKEYNGSTKSGSFAILFNVQELALQRLYRETDSIWVERHGCNPVGMGVPQIDPKDLRVAMEMHRRATAMLDTAPFSRRVIAVYVCWEICK
jgi:hypothetical protein